MASDSEHLFLLPHPRLLDKGLQFASEHLQLGPEFLVLEPELADHDLLLIPHHGVLVQDSPTDGISGLDCSAFDLPLNGGNYPILLRFLSINVHHNSTVFLHTS